MSSLTQEFRELSIAGECVCDFDVACRVHPSTECSACEYGCHCRLHNYRHSECDCPEAANLYDPMSYETTHGGRV